MRQVALITGGSRGIGFGVAKQLAAKGFNLAINGVRNENEVIGALEELRTANVEVIYCQGDVSSAKDRESIIQKVKAHFGKLNVLVNNAGVAPKERKDILEASEESFDRVVSINLKGPYFLTQQIANWMIEQKNADSAFTGSIINVTSVSAMLASVNRGEYCISKAGLGMTTQLFAMRLAEYNIPVFEVRPGIIATDMTAAVKDKYDKMIAEGLNLQQRWGYPDDVGKAVAALAEGSFAYSTGQVIMVDGGMTVPRL